MQIRIRETGQVVFESEFRSLFPDTSFPQQLTEDLLNDFGADVVFNGPQPQATRYQIVRADGVEQDDEGRWLTKHVAVDVEADVVETINIAQAQSVRAARDALLAETDWRFRSDMTPSQAWKDYCQALRDVPSQEGFPWDIQWPEKPV